jgi:hypothetical protein
MEYHKHKFDDYSLLIFKDDILIAVLPAHIKGKVLHTHQGLTYGGLVYKQNLRLKDILNTFKLVLSFLEEKKIDVLSLKTIPQIYYKTPDFSFDYLLKIVKCKQVKTDVLSVVNPASKNYSKDRKAGYKRGLKHHLRVEETDDLSLFWQRILVPNLKEKHQVNPVHNLEEITLLKSRFEKQIRQFNVYHNNELVAGTTIFETDTVAHSQYISGNVDKNKLGSLDFLHIHLLENVFQNKPYFDFGTSNENQGKQINEGLRYWKQGFGASIYLHDFYTVETKNHVLLDHVLV